MSTNKKNNRSNQMSVRFSEHEHDLITWLSKRIGVERANVPRHVLAAFMTDRPDLDADFHKEVRQPTEEMVDVEVDVDTEAE